VISHTVLILHHRITLTHTHNAQYTIFPVRTNICDVPQQIVVDAGERGIPPRHQLNSKYGQFFARKPQVLLHSSVTTIALSVYCCWRYLLNTVSGSKHCHEGQLLIMHCVTCSGLRSLECFVITKCTKFGQLILRKIIKIVVTRCQILRLKCTKFDFGWGSTPDPAGELTALPQTP